VGFISDLPHELVAAFRATLEEVAEADVVLHVRDISSPDSDAQAADVAAVLDQIDPDGRRNEIEVWNKIDRLDGEDRALIHARARRRAEAGDRPAAAVSAVSGEGIDALLELVSAHVDTAPEIEVLAPPGEGEAVAWLYQNGRVSERSDEADGSVRLIVRLDDQALGRFERLFPEACRLNAAQ
jgi:GTP-binding protein HflX